MSQPQPPPPTWTGFLATRLIPVSRRPPPPGNSADDDHGHSHQPPARPSPTHRRPPQQIRSAGPQTRPHAQARLPSARPSDNPLSAPPAPTRAALPAVLHLALHVAGVDAGWIMRKAALEGEDGAVVKAVEGAVDAEVARIGGRGARVRKLAEKGWHVVQGWWRGWCWRR